jgi:hypothetical protein
MIIIFSLIMSFMTQAAVIKGGSFNPEKNKIELDLEYSGGCGEHDFRLSNQLFCTQFGNSVEYCKVRLLHSTDDMCRMLILKTHEFEIPEITRPFYLRVKGDKDSSVRVYIY